MKKYYALLAGTMLAISFQTHAQTKIGGTGAPDGSAMLEVTGGTGNNKGILPPRLTTVQRDAINLPAKALMIYNTTTNQLQVNTGTPAAPIWSVSSGGNAWNLTGNAGTNPTSNYIGTADGQPLIIRTDATERMRVQSTGNIGIATNFPQQTLHVEGTARVTGSTGTPTAITGRNATGDIGNVSVGTGLNLAAGILSATPATPGWNLAGNTGSNPNINYIGTADGQPLIIRTDAIERMRVQSTGNIGIATNFPQQTLHVEGTARVTGSTGTSTAIMGRDGFGNIGNVSVGTGLNLAGGVLSTPPGWDLAGNTGSDPNINYIGTADGQPLIIRTDAIERMRVQSTGNIGIATNFPQQTLHVEGTARVTGSTGTPTAITGRNATGDIGNVSVGTGLNLAAGVLSATPATSGWNLAGNTGSNPDINYIGTADGQPLIIRTDAIERMRVQSTGNIGIATNFPQQTLHVEGTARVTGSAGTSTTIMGRDASGNVGNVSLGANLSLTGGVLSASGGGGTTGWGLTGNAGTNPATNYIGTTDAQDLALRTSAIEQMRVTAAGNVGIGTNAPTAKLDITNGDIALKQTFALRWGGETDERIYADRDLGYPGANLFMESRENMAFTIDRNNTASTSNTVGFIWSTNSSWKDGIPQELMRLTDAGNLGVGVVTPAYKLDVAGDINASASVRANGVALTSDARLKRNISSTIHGLSTIMNLRPVEYDKKNNVEATNYNRHEIGFIAQEIRKVLPSLVSEGNDAHKTLSVSYTELIPVLTKAIQEQQAQIESLKAENQKLQNNEAVTAQLVERVKQMEQMMGIKGAESASKAVSK